MKVVSLNMKTAFGGNELNARLAALVAQRNPDIALLQDCTKPGLQTVCEVAGLQGVHSHEVSGGVQDGFVKDGTAIAVREPLHINDAERIESDSFRPEAVDAELGQDPPFVPEPSFTEDQVRHLMNRFSSRTLLARITSGDSSFLAGSFYATPASGMFWGKKSNVLSWKPYFHSAVAIELATRDDPFVFGIDANESGAEVLRQASETPEGWGLRVAALLGKDPMHRARDLLIEKMEQAGVEPPYSNAFTYDTGGKHGKLRFDSIWATPDFALEGFEIDYDAVVQAGGDHALLAADLSLAAS